MANKVLDIFQKNDGFWVGSEKKNGCMAKGSYHITGEDIMTMFTTLYKDFCQQQGSEQFVMKDGDGTIIVATKINTESRGRKIPHQI